MNDQIEVPAAVVAAGARVMRKYDPDMDRIEDYVIEMILAMEMAGLSAALAERSRSREKTKADG